MENLKEKNSSQAQATEDSEKFPEQLFVVAAKEIKDTGRVSFGFIFRCDMPREMQDKFIHDLYFGILKIGLKDDNFFSPFKWADACKLRSEGKHEEAEKIQFIGDDGVPRFDIFIFNSDKGERKGGQILTASIDDKILDKEAKKYEALSEEETDALALVLRPVPNKSVILVHASLLERIKGVCKRNNVNLEFHEFDGELSTN